MENRKRMAKAISFVIGLLLLLCLFPEQVHAQRKEADIKKLLPGYEDWFTWFSDPFDTDYTVMICPKENLDEDAIVRYLEDITRSLDGELDRDETKVKVEFSFSVSKYGQNVEKFQNYAFDLKRRLNYQWTYWSGLDMLELQPSYSETDKIIGYSLNVYLDLNGGFSDYSSKLKSIVEESKKVAGNDKRKQVNWLCSWLFEHVDYTPSLITNSAYVAVMSGEAICGGYANALRDLCDVAGIPALVLTSNSENHAWNQVYVDGKWYTVDVVGLVYSLSNQDDREKEEYLFDDPNIQCDAPAFLEKLKKEMLTPTPILSQCVAMTVTKPCNIKKYVRNTVPGAQITYKSGKASVVTVNSQGEICPVSEGTANINIKVVQNNKTYQLVLKVKCKTKFHKKGTSITYKNGTYKVVKQAKKSGKKISAGTVEWTGVSSKTLSFFSIPAKLKIGGVTYKVVSVAKNALKNNKKIKKLTIPSSITKIGSRAFYGCSSLNAITIKTNALTNKNVGSKAFGGISSKAVIKVPKKKWKVYRTLLKKKGIGKKAKVKKA